MNNYQKSQLKFLRISKNFIRILQRNLTVIFIIFSIPNFKFFIIFAIKLKLLLNIIIKFIILYLLGKFIIFITENANYEISFFRK